MSKPHNLDNILNPVSSGTNNAKFTPKSVASESINSVTSGTNSFKPRAASLSEDTLIPISSGTNNIQSASRTRPSVTSIPKATNAIVQAASDAALSEVTTGDTEQIIKSGDNTFIVRTNKDVYVNTYEQVVENKYITSDAGCRILQENSQSTSYTTVASDSGKFLYHPSTDPNPRTFTIASNANLPYQIGTAISFINETAEVLTIEVESDTLVLACIGSTGSRSLAQYGVATAIKVGSTRWYISGTGIS